MSPPVNRPPRDDERRGERARVVRFASATICINGQRYEGFEAGDVFSPARPREAVEREIIERHSVPVEYLDGRTTGLTTDMSTNRTKQDIGDD